MATKVVFPASPLTTNKLTPQQRTLLVRKARKIEQLLGSTPRLFDTSVAKTLAPINITLSSTSSQRRVTKSNLRSFDSTSFGSSSSSFSSISRTTSFSSRLSSLGYKRGTSTVESLDPSEAWPCDTKVPILLLPVDSLSTPASSPGTFIDTSAIPQPPSTHEGLPDDLPVLSPTIVTDISPHDSATVSIPTTPSPSSNSIRRQKMDRLRRKLGSHVPLDLVFPKGAPDSSTSSGLTSTQHDRPLVSSAPQQMKTTAGAARFTDARDPAMSLSDAIAASVALARQQNPDSSTSSPTHNVRQKRPRSAPAAEFRRKERLSLIMESPEEHRLSRSDTCDLSRETDADLRPQSLLADDSVKSLNVDELRLRGERRKNDDLESKTGVNQTVCLTQLPRRPATAPAFISTPPTWEPSGDSPAASKGSPKRRPSSYRKPPPPLPAGLNC